MYYTKKVNLLYSLGKEVLEVKMAYEKLLGYYVKVWDIEYGYIELIRILSLGTLLKIEGSNSNLKILENKINLNFQYELTLNQIKLTLKP